jgi:hypothetical protein
VGETHSAVWVSLRYWSRVDVFLPLVEDFALGGIGGEVVADDDARIREGEEDDHHCNGEQVVHCLAPFAREYPSDRAHVVLDSRADELMSRLSPVGCGRKESTRRVDLVVTLVAQSTSRVFGAGS